MEATTSSTRRTPAPKENINEDLIYLKNTYDRSGLEARVKILKSKSNPWKLYFPCLNKKYGYFSFWKSEYDEINLRELKVSAIDQGASSSNVEEIVYTIERKFHLYESIKRWWKFLIVINSTYVAIALKIM